MVTNSGQTNYAGITVTDSLVGLLTDSVYNIDATVVGGGGGDVCGTRLSWSGDLLIGASVTVSFSVTVADPDLGDKSMVNNVSSIAPGSGCPPGSLAATCSAEVTVLVPALGVTKTVDTATVTAGGTVNYTIVLVNTGQTDYAPATFTDSLTNVLDDAGYSGNAIASSGVLDFSNSVLSWSGALLVGQTATITYSVVTLFPATGDHSLTNTVLSPSAGSTCITGLRARCHTAVTELVPAMTIVKTVDATQVVAGGAVHFNILVTNTGQAAYPSATLTDSLADVLDDAVWADDQTATSGVVTVVAGVLSWTGNLPLGATVLISYSVLVNVTDADDAALSNRVESTAVGNTCTPASADPRCVTSTTIAARSITLAGLTPSFTLTGLPGSTVTQDNAVTMTVTTNSQAGYLVTVLPDLASMVPGLVGNSDRIPIGLLKVRGSGISVFQPLLAASSLIVHQQDTPSSPDGDAVSNDYQIQIPFVSADTYSSTLEYIAVAQ